jgi:hypothetical protein
METEILDLEYAIQCAAAAAQSAASILTQLLAVYRSGNSTIPELVDEVSAAMAATAAESDNLHAAVEAAREAGLV